MTDPRARARELSRSGDPLRWFETLYAEAGDDLTTIPWADRVPNPHLITWLEGSEGRALVERIPSPRALVVGCGLGDDAEELARRGFDTVAFDIAPRAVDLCRSRFPDTSVEYHAANLLNPPAAWLGAFDLVVEISTLQVLPESLRRLALPALARLPRPGGSLLVIARGRNLDEEVEGFPWPLAREELDPLTEPRTPGADPPRLWEASFEDFPDGEDPPVRRFRVEYRRVADPANEVAGN